MNDAILAAGKSLSTRPKGNRRIIYVLSDGKESRSKANFREVVQYLESNQVAVYGTLVGDSATWGLGYLDKFKIPLLPFSPDSICPSTRLPPAATSIPSSRPTEFSAASRELAALARTQYTLGYYSKHRCWTVDIVRLQVDVNAAES